MTNIIRRARAWLPLFRLGNIFARRNEQDAYSKYLVLNTVKDAGIFEFLEKPRTLDELIKQFDWEYPSRYVDDFLNYLVSDKVLSLKDGKYKFNGTVDLSKPEVKYIEDFNAVFAEYSPAIPDRLQGKYLEFTGKLSLFSWDSALAGHIYQAIRDSTFNFVNIKQFRNSRLLDVACGSGYETVDLWLQLKDKNNELIAIDNDSKLLKIAQEEFCLNIAHKGHKEVSWDELDNPPRFVLASADNLTMFEDNSFDAVYFSNFLHWMNHPLEGLKEMSRVLKPNGLLFGAQGTSEDCRPYLDLTSRVMKNVYGFFPRKQFRAWLEEAGFQKIQFGTRINFEARKQG